VKPQEGKKTKGTDQLATDPYWLQILRNFSDDKLCKLGKKKARGKAHLEKLAVGKEEKNRQFRSKNRSQEDGRTLGTPNSTRPLIGGPVRKRLRGSKKGT